MQIYFHFFLFWQMQTTEFQHSSSFILSVNIKHDTKQIFLIKNF